ncbi:MAG TPA: TadE/TadG family type IV pilus assembly protein [Candidatus Polarisedimenticolia bacterium]|nr:TadE/TadG family type IV pilus assembly protein [Candidatus Polarisedimenticolia bacterium]
MKRFGADRSGQSMVEFALVVVMLLLLVVGICEFGRVWNLYQILANAAREGARLAALPTGFTNAGAVTTRVQGYLQTGNVDPNRATITIGAAGVDGGTGTQVSVTVTYPYSFLYVGPVIRMINPGATAGADITINAQSIMRNE